MDNKGKIKNDITMNNNVELKTEVSVVHLSEKEKLPNNISNNDNNKYDKKKDRRKKEINNVKELKEYNINRLMINNFWIELFQSLFVNTHPLFYILFIGFKKR